MRKPSLRSSSASMLSPRGARNALGSNCCSAHCLSNVHHLILTAGHSTTRIHRRLSRHLNQSTVHCHLILAKTSVILHLIYSLNYHPEFRSVSQQSKTIFFGFRQFVQMICSKTTYQVHYANSIHHHVLKREGSIYNYHLNQKWATSITVYIHFIKYIVLSKPVEQLVLLQVNDLADEHLMYRHTPDSSISIQ